MKLAFVDVETTGLKPGVNRVIEVAAVIAEAAPTGLSTIDTLDFQQVVDLTQGPWSAKALEVNGYFPGHPDWDGAPKAGSRKAQELWKKLADLLAGCTLCSQNVSFDRDFIAAEMAYFDLPAKWGRRTFDLQGLAALVAIKHGLASASLHAAYDALGGPKLPEHRAMTDVQRGVYLYKTVAGAFFAA